MADASRILIGLSSRVVQIAVRMVNNHEDPVFRNGVMAYIKQLKKGTEGGLNVNSGKLQVLGCHYHKHKYTILVPCSVES